MQLPIELVGGTNRNRSKRIAETKCINLIPERVSQGGRSTSAYHGAPGSILEHDFGASVRGLEFLVIGFMRLLVILLIILTKRQR